MGRSGILLTVVEGKGGWAIEQVEKGTPARACRAGAVLSCWKCEMRAERELVGVVAGGAEGLLGRGGGADGGHGAGGQAGEGGSPTGEVGDRPADVGTLADVVVGDVCGEPVLEGGARSVHAGAVSKDTALVVVQSLRDRSVGSIAEVAAIASPADHGLGAGATG